VSFSDDGKYLMFSSARDFKPTFGEEEFENVYRDMQRVYSLPYRRDTSTVGPRSDEVGKKKKDEDKEGAIRRAKTRKAKRRKTRRRSLS
jgi:tricorn protease